MDGQNFPPTRIYYSVTKLHHKNDPMSLFSGGIWASGKFFSSAVLDWYHIRGGDCYFCIPHCHAHEKQETIVLQNIGGGGGDKVHYRQCHNGK